MTWPFLVQMEVVGGPPLVTPIRVKILGDDDDDEGDTRILVIAPCPRENV